MSNQYSKPRLVDPTEARNYTEVWNARAGRHFYHHPNCRCKACHELDLQAEADHYGSDRYASASDENHFAVTRRVA